MKKSIRYINNLNSVRLKKDNYQDIPIDSNNPLFNEPLVAIHQYGLAGQSYYSRKNPGTVDPVKGVSEEPYLRKTVVEKLAQINSLLTKDKYIANHFKFKVELFIQEGYRSPELQRILYEKSFPKLLREQYPGISESQIKKKLSELVAKPSIDAQRPAPHVTGGAFDLRLRKKESTPLFVYNEPVLLSKKSADVSEVNYPDYFEDPKNIHSTEDKKIQFNRRLFFSIMSGEYFGLKTDFACNPTEWWHWSWGDQLWAYVNNKKTAIYSVGKIE